MNLESLLAKVPDYAKDLKLNLSSVLRQTELTEQQLWGTAVCSALASRNPRSRYLVGLDARWAAFLDRLAPTWVSDRVKRLPFGL